jgi:hypothetical protein
MSRPVRELVFAEDVAIPGQVGGPDVGTSRRLERVSGPGGRRRLFDLGLLAGYRRDPDRLSCTT